MNAQRRRGSYKAYLRNDDAVPYSTLRSRQKRAQVLRIPQPAAENLIIDEQMNDDEPINNEEWNNIEMEQLQPIFDENVHSDNETNIPIEYDNNSDNEHNMSDDDIFEDAEEHFDNAEYAQEENEPIRVPLYDGCQISKEEAYLLLLHFAIRHHLTDVALQHLIALVDMLLPNMVFRSSFLFLKQFPSLTSIIKSYYCPSCHVILNTQNDAQRRDKTLICSQCNEIFNESFLNSKMHYFLRMSIEDQLRAIVNSDTYTLMRRENNSYSDITSGSFYKSLVRSGVISGNDITLQFNTDGVQLCRSSSLSLWPIQICINELPYTIRKEKMILCGLWYGRDKPNMHLFVKPIIEELSVLHEKGISRNVVGEPEVHIKVHTIVSPVDSVARSILQEIVQFNGHYGCSFCLHEGVQVPIGRGTTRVYPGDICMPRTLPQHERDCEEALKNNISIRGVKGPSVFMLLPVFHVIKSFTPDYLHSVLLGVVKTFTETIFDPANHEKPWYIGRHTAAFDDKLLQIKPPSELTRTPRSITERKIWKGSEWKNYLLYYSIICLKNKMPERYVKHWFLLVFSMHVFLKEKIYDEEFAAAEVAIKTFVLEIGELYGVEYYKFNCHLMLHIPESVRRFGALWASSTFPFEHYNGVLSKMFKSSNAIPEQICKSYLRYKSVEQLSTTAFSRRNCSQDAKNLFKRMSEVFRPQRCITYGSDLRLFGKSVQIQLSVIEKTEIEALIREEIQNYAEKFDRFIFLQTLWHTESYKLLKKRHNSTVELQDGSFVTLQSILGIRTTLSNELKYIIIGKRLQPSNEVICSTQQYRITSKNLFVIATATENITAFLPNVMRSKCVRMPYRCTNDGDQTYCIVRLVNNVETD